MTNPIEQHYTSEGIAERVLEAVRATLAPGSPLTAEALALTDHFHGRGVVATRELAALLEPKAGERILDIGCGIGGPARWIAERFGCHVTGIDLTVAFCRAAESLNAATGLAGRVEIVNGSATALPFGDAAFDRAYSQNVVMNIADKAAFHREAARVLKPGGRLVLSNLAAGPGGAPYYPAPWAEMAATSFLSTPEATRAEIEAAGLEIVSFRDTTPDILPDQIKQRQRLEAGGAAPKLGTHLIMGPRMRDLQLNSIRNLEEGRTLTLEVVARRRP